MSKHHLIDTGKATVDINGRTYKLRYAKEPIMEGEVRCLSQINHEKALIEFDPEVPMLRFPSLMAKIVALAWKEAVEGGPAFARNGREALSAKEMKGLEKDFAAFVKKVGL